MAPVLCADIDDVVAAPSCLDMESVIEAFLTDPTQNSLELPHMTTGQRKHARKLVDQHGELKCESYGLGAERQLHIFKITSPKSRSPSSRGIANGMIAETEAAGVSLDVEAVITGFLQDATQTELELPHMSAAQRKRVAHVVDRHVELTCECNGLGCARQLHIFKNRQTGANSTTNDHIPTVGINSEYSTSASSRASRSPSNKDRDLLSLPQGCQVRNTFIHMSGLVAADERVVRSMPHGMFGQCLNDEVAEKLWLAALQLSPAALKSKIGVVASEPCLLASGTQVVIDGLSKSPAFNGLTGVVQSWDAEIGRYSILLSSPSCGRSWAKVKGENLHVAGPPPPKGDAPGFFSSSTAHSEVVEPTFLGFAEMPPSPTWEDSCGQCFPR